MATMVFGTSTKACWLYGLCIASLCLAVHSQAKTCDRLVQVYFDCIEERHLNWIAWEASFIVDPVRYSVLNFIYT